MSEPRFTKGPWRFDETDPPGAYAINSAVELRPNSNGAVYVGQVTTKANAQITAAAPDLYAALFRLAGGWFDPAKVRHDPDCECGGCEAYRALAKARGE